MRSILALVGLAVFLTCGMGAGRAAAADATVTYLITNGGVDVKGKADFHIYPRGTHGPRGTLPNPNVGNGVSGVTVNLPAGVYDVRVSFADDYAHKDIWLDNQTLSGAVRKTVELGLPLADVRYLITNGGVDVKGKGDFHIYPKGTHGPTGTLSNANVGHGGSGVSARIAGGVYDVRVSFSDGQASRDVWLDNQVLSGTVSRTVEVGVALADVRYLITNNGVDVKGRGDFHIYPRGTHGPSGTTNAGNVAHGGSGDTVRLASGVYDVRISFAQDLAKKDVWLDSQTLSGLVHRTVELGVIFTQPTVRVTLDGADAGDKAHVTYFAAGAPNPIGGVDSGQPTLLVQGVYDIHAGYAGAEGWLRKVALSGKPALTIALQKPKVETLRAGAPPPKACTIEVYGVNFDFDKSVLRADSEPTLKLVLGLFTAAPGFTAEVGGHTDNVGSPAYNLKLSDARAAAVKAWLVQHGLAASRVTSRGYGDTQPLVPNTTDENRFKNRRVELRRANCR